jgi:hypothetical protein
MKKTTNGIGLVTGANKSIGHAGHTRADACQSGYTFFRRTTSAQSKADQTDKITESIFTVYGATITGTEVASGTSYGSIAPETASQSGAYFVRYDGVSGVVTTTRIGEPVAAAVGLLAAAPPQFQAACDLPKGGVLLALPALLAVGLLRHTTALYALPNGF